MTQPDTDAEVEQTEAGDSAETTEDAAEASEA